MEDRDASATQQTSLQTRQLTREKSDHRPYFLARRTKICCYVDRAGKRDGGKAMAGREEQDGEGEMSRTARARKREWGEQDSNEKEVWATILSTAGALSSTAHAFGR